MSSTLWASAVTESARDFVCASAAVIRSAAAGAFAVDFCRGALGATTPGAVAADGAAAWRDGTRPSIQSAAAIATIKIAPMPALMACDFSRLPKLRPEPLPAGSASAVFVPAGLAVAPSGEAAADDDCAGEAGFSTSVAVSSMVGGRRPGLLSGSLVMLFPQRVRRSRGHRIKAVSRLNSGIVRGEGPFSHRVRSERLPPPAPRSG